MCSTPSPAAFATKPPSLVGLDKVIYILMAMAGHINILIFKMKMIRGKNMSGIKSNHHKILQLPAMNIEFQFNQPGSW